MPDVLACMPDIVSVSVFGFTQLFVLLSRSGWMPHLPQLPYWDCVGHVVDTNQLVENGSQCRLLSFNHLSVALVISPDRAVENSPLRCGSRLNLALWGAARH
jgi:hypothetical protein